MIPAPLRGWGALLPCLLFLAVWFLYPVGELLALGLRTPDGGWGLENFRRIADTPAFLAVLGVTFRIALWTTLLSLLGAYPLAHAIAVAPARPGQRLLFCVLLAFWTSFLVRSLAWVIVLGRYGPVNQALLAAGITEVPLRLLYNLGAALAGMVQVQVPLAVLTMLPVMRRIDPGLLRAANVLGAGPAQRFWRVWLPLSLPGVAAAALLVFVSSLGFFIMTALLGGARETMVSQVIITQLQELLNWPFAAALSVVLLLTTLGVVVAFNRLTGTDALSDQPGRGGRAGSGVVARALCGGLGDLCARLPDWPRLGGWLRHGAVLALLGFLLLPMLALLAASVSSGPVLQVPPQGFSLRWYTAYLASPVWLTATLNSLSLATVAALIALLLGGAAALALVRFPLPGRGLVLAVILSPMIVPRIIIAVALFYLYGRIGLVGSWLGLALGHVVLALPFVVVTLMATLAAHDVRLDQAAATLGAPPWRVLRHVTLPLIRGGVVSAFLFAFITSFDDLTIALFVNGGALTTLPRQMWNDMLMQAGPTLAAVSCLLLGVVTLVLLAVGVSLRRG
ncbi:ABC transporter permease subunit [Rhodovastum atsumiense]|uniref:ABC transporter permease subunit n=1 Tax=Rhodovastum atsumiense TaxID=504468 RepID=A0A5M6IYM8_9PROT|nr:ABC transporter permease subunit [Rhodovastum atsumiense]KAA5613450.1 ABC transporter permease subunit [Rhodovastum atsumiense]CAH2603185.1 ABC transporter permease subunit [Rhodovastum atsumiense]